MRNLSKRHRLAVILLSVCTGLSLGIPPAGAQITQSDASATARLNSALATQAATRSTLRVLGDAFTCDVARFISYRRSTAEPELADQWYVASQLWADAALLVALAPGGTNPGGWPSPAAWNEADARCHLDKGFIFLDRLWDYTSSGYYARSNPTGTQVEQGARYADDNALGGLALLTAAQSLPDGQLRRRYLHAAVREAEFLTQSDVWDDTFGGGFWWNTDRGATFEGKPAQTNAIAALFFARLYEATGLELYRDWALRTLLWMDTILYDPERQLYRWSVHYEDPDRRLGAVLSQRFFNYDQGIAIEAQLRAARLDGDPNRLSRAQAIGRALHTAFWGETRGGYNLEAGIEQVYTSYAAWSSLGHLALYDLDGNPLWLQLAQRNADALAAALREPDGGYAYRHYRCVDRIAPGCESGQIPWVVDRTRDTAAQAWMQHLEVEIARRLMSERTEAGGGS